MSEVYRRAHTIFTAFQAAEKQRRQIDVLRLLFGDLIVPPNREP